eukprot:14757394-Alexandrium_andersonii.AAC.1
MGSVMPAGCLVTSAPCHQWCVRLRRGHVAGVVLVLLWGIWHALGVVRLLRAVLRLVRAACIAVQSHAGGRLAARGRCRSVPARA